MTLSLRSLTLSAIPVIVLAALLVLPVVTSEAFAAPKDPKTDTKVRAVQNGAVIDEENAGMVGIPIDCVGGIDSSAGAVQMVCYLIPPNVPNNTNEHAIATLDTTTNSACPDDSGFQASHECFNVTFDASLFAQTGDWHFHVEFYDENGELIADGNQTFQNVSFFVLPESAMGAIAVVGASVAALGGYTVLRSGRGKI